MTGRGHLLPAVGQSSSSEFRFRVRICFASPSRYPSDGLLPAAHAVARLAGASTRDCRLAASSERADLAESSDMHGMCLRSSISCNSHNASELPSAAAPAIVKTRGGVRSEPDVGGTSLASIRIRWRRDRVSPPLSKNHLKVQGTGALRSGPGSIRAANPSSGRTTLVIDGSDRNHNVFGQEGAAAGTCGRANKSTIRTPWRV